MDRLNSKGVDRLNTKGVDRLRTSLTVRTVPIQYYVSSMQKMNEYSNITPLKYGSLLWGNPYSNVFTVLVEAIKIWCGQTVYRRIFLLMSLLIIKNIPHIK